ncbi:MAG: hypothetical protein WKF84_17970 [Pyrinomonadaceae bacterium]
MPTAARSPPGSSASRPASRAVAMVLGYSELTVNAQSGLPSSAYRRSSFCDAWRPRWREAQSLDHLLAHPGKTFHLRRSVFDQVGGYSSMLHRIAGDDMLMLQLVNLNRNSEESFTRMTQALTTVRTLKKPGARFAISARVGPLAGRTIFAET